MKNLTIVVDPDCLKYCITDNDVIVELIEVPFNKELSNFNEILGGIKNHLSDDFQIRVFINNPEFTMVPLELFDENNPQVFVKNTTHQDSNKVHSLRWEKIKNENLVIIYFLNNELENAILDHFPNVVIRHQVNAIFSSGLPSEYSFIYAHWDKDRLDLTAIAQNRLAIKNIYFVESDKDALYYILLLYDQINLKLDSVNLYLSGTIEKESEFIKMLEQYIANVKVLDIPQAKLNAKYIISKSQRFYDLYLSSKCG